MHHKVYKCIILCINWNHSCSNSSFIHISPCYTSCFFPRTTKTMHYFILQYFSLRFVCIHQVMGELRQLLSMKKAQQESRDNTGSWLNKIIIFLSFITIIESLLNQVTNYALGSATLDRKNSSTTHIHN